MASTGHPGLKTLGSRLHEYQAQWAEVDRQIAERALESIEPHWKTYLVHSQSQTLKTFFRRLAEQSEKAIVYQTESRPLFEGREQAKWLDRLGYQVHLITEAQCAHAVSESDAIVCGADRVYTDGFVNKVGTLNLAILAKYFRKPLLVLYDGRKWMDASAPRNKQEKNQDPEEIWERPEGHIEIRNYYFEWIPSHLVGTFISEAGIHMPNEPA
jgi:translation initiation factor 2B subunit (eIF-2B alpha/beta/delta family)